MTMWTRARHPETGGEGIVPVDSLDVLGARGWQAYGQPSADRNELQVQIDTEAQEAALAARREADRLAAGGGEATVQAVLGNVGDDPGKARAALDAEQAKDRPRSTLVDALSKVIESAGTAGNEGE